MIRGRRARMSRWPTGSVSLPVPLAYYKLNDGSGTVATDSSGNAFDANAVAPNPTWGAGKFNGGGVFAGGYYQNTTIGLGVNGGPYSVAGWLNLNLGVTADSGWFGLGTGSGLDSVLILRATTSGTSLVFAQFQDDLIVTGLADMRGAFVHVVATLDANKNQTLYLNGVQVGARVATGFLVANGNLFIGHEGAAATSWAGTLDEIRLYNVALTPPQVTALFNLVPGP